MFSFLTGNLCKYGLVACESSKKNELIYFVSLFLHGTLLYLFFHFKYLYNEFTTRLVLKFNMLYTLTLLFLFYFFFPRIYYLWQSYIFCPKIICIFPFTLLKNFLIISRQKVFSYLKTFIFLKYIIYKLYLMFVCLFLLYISLPI